MSICTRNSTDPLLRSLVSYGINIIVPPRVGIAPGDLMLSDGDHSIRKAEWSAVLGFVPELTIAHEPTFESIAFDASGHLDVSLGATLVSRALKAFGFSDSRLLAGFRKANATKLTIALQAPAVSRIQSLDSILVALRSHPISIPSDYRTRRLFVVDATWRARGLAIDLVDSSALAARTAADVSDELNLSGEFRVADQGDGKLTFLAAKPLIFGITLRELVSAEGTLSERSVHEYLTVRSNGGNNWSYLGKDDFFVEVN